MSNDNETKKYDNTNKTKVMHQDKKKVERESVNKNISNQGDPPRGWIPLSSSKERFVIEEEK